MVDKILNRLVENDVVPTKYIDQGDNTYIDEGIIKLLTRLNKEAKTSIVLGDIDKFSIIHKFGRNLTVPNGTWEQISTLSIATSFLQAPTTVRVKAGNAADDVGGVGAREITIIGIDSNLNEVTETLTTAGASAGSSSSTSFWRLYRAYVSDLKCGTYGGNNTGNVIIENTAGDTDLIEILAGFGQSQHGAYTIPVGFTAYLYSAIITVDAGKAADIRLFMRKDFNIVSEPFSPVRLHQYWDGVLGVIDYKPGFPEGPFPALTDIWFEAKGAGASTEVSVSFNLLLIQD